jgi:hypothetical protein
MFVFESIEDILKGKTKNEIQSNFKEKYGIEFSEMPETVKRLQAMGIDAKIGYLNILEEENNRPIKIPVIEINRLEIKTTNNGHQWNVIGTTLSEKAAEEIIKVLKKYLNIGDRAFINSNREEHEYEIEKEPFIYQYSNLDALKILSKMQK